MLPVLTSAYMMTVPCTLRAARPDVWMSAPAERRNPSLSASRMATSDTSGRSRPSRSRLMPDQHVERAAPQVAQDLDALERLDVRVQVAHPHAELVVVLRQVLGHALGERGHEHALFRRDARADLGQQVVHLPRHGPDDPRRGRPGPSAGSPARQSRRRSSAARTARAWPRRTRPGGPAPSHSAKFSGRLSRADGRRNP